MDNHNNITDRADNVVVQLLGSTHAGKTKYFTGRKERHLHSEMTYEAYVENLRMRETLIRRKNRSFYLIWPACIMGAAVIVILSLSYFDYITHVLEPISFIQFFIQTRIIEVVIALMVSVFLICVGIWSLITITEQTKLSKIEADIYAYEHTQLSDQVDADIYESSVKMSYTYLNEYYQETRDQATRGFKITVGVCVIGAVIVGIGIILIVFNDTTAAYITTASGIIIEFISSIFFHLYNKTIQSMGNYHNKLILSQNVAIALRISESIEGPDKDSIKADLIKALTTDINQHINSNKPAE